MKVTVIGTHNLETRTTKHTCFLIDDVLAVDAGSLVTSVDRPRLEDLQALLVTHHHFDHIRDIPTLGLLRRDVQGLVSIHAPETALQAVHAHIFNGAIYPDLTQPLNQTSPRYDLAPMVPEAPSVVAGHGVLAVPMPHAVPSMGYIVQSSDGDCVGFTGDTAGNLSPFFRHDPVPRVLFVDVTFPNRVRSIAKASGHLTPSALAKELLRTKAKANGPIVVAVHRNVDHESELRQELANVSSELGIEVVVAEEGMAF